MKKLKVLSLFDGMSCGRLALEQLGFKDEVIEYYASEIKPHGIKVSKENFPNVIQIGDVTKVSFKDGILVTENGEFNVGEFDMVIGGSPCTQFSIACIKEKRLGLEGEDSKLFYEYLRILKEVNPKYFLLENVASMSNDSKRQLDEYMEVEGIKINSQYLTPASRNRLYWTNFKTTKLENTRTDSLNDILTEGFAKKEVSSCLLEGHSRHLEKGFIPIVYKSEDHYEELIKHYNEHYKGLTAKEVDNIREGIDNSVYEDVRVLNATEMERLQGVKEGYTSSISRNKSASLLGDGWTVPVISHLMSELKVTYVELLK